MSSKLLQLPNRASTRVVRVNVTPLRWTGLDPSLGEDGFLRGWLQEDLEEQGKAGRRIHWGAVFGLALAFALSAGFWAGLGLLISRFV